MPKSKPSAFSFVTNISLICSFMFRAGLKAISCLVFIFIFFLLCTEGKYMGEWGMKKGGVRVVGWEEGGRIEENNV